MKKFCYFLLISVLGHFSCNSPKYHVFEGFAQGTTFRIVYQSGEIYNDTLVKMLQYFDKTLSLYQDNSLISRINRNDSSVVLNELFIEFLEKSRFVFEKSNGYFDITVAPLVETWGFGTKEKINSDTASIDSLKTFVGMDKIRLEDGKLIKSDERIRLDGNAIAQGQSVDYLAKYLEAAGVENYLIEIGGEVRVKGVNEKGIFWRIGVDKPLEGTDAQDRKIQTILQLKNKSLATSGNYRKFHLVNGIKYSHSINPKTGFPSQDVLLSASVIADECSIADAYATACMVMGLEKAKLLIDNNKEIEAYLVYSDQGELKVFMSKGFVNYLDE